MSQSQGREGALFLQELAWEAQSWRARMRALEGGVGALALASGQAAVTYSLLTIAEAGDNIVSASTLYGGTYNLFAHTLPQYGIQARFADYRDPKSFEPLIDARTKAVFVESLGNPQGNVTDIAKIAEVAHRHGVPLIVDNTLASPYLIRPIEWGADIVCHSTTKFLCGNGSAMGGAVIDSGKFNWGENDKFPMMDGPEPAYDGINFFKTFGPMAFTMRAHAVGLRDLGANQSPMNAFLTLNGIETLPLRMDRHMSNTRRVVEFLASQPFVARVGHPLTLQRSASVKDLARYPWVLARRWELERKALDDLFAQAGQPAIEAQVGIEINSRMIDLDEAIRSLGTHAVTVRLHHDVQFPVSVSVVTA